MALVTLKRGDSFSFTATTANITLSAPQTIDGIAVVAGDRVLVKNQTDSKNNGIYIVNASTWTRATDADSAEKIASALVAVDSGTTNGGTTWDNDFKTTDTLGTTAMTWNSIADNGKKLSYFSATTSAELAGVISDETGTGKLVFATSPSFTTSVVSASATLDVFDTTATTVNAFGATTTLNLGYDGTATSTTNIVTGASASATTKTINIGTGGATGSTTNINLGSASGGTVTINKNLNVSGTVTLSADPTANLQAATKQYVDNKTNHMNPIIAAIIFGG